MKWIQKTFRSSAETMGTDGEDWEFPGHYQHVRVFYVYLYKPELYSPELAKTIRAGFEGFEGNWIGEFECYNAPGSEDGSIIDMVYLDGEFIFDAAAPYAGLSEALNLSISQAGVIPR